MNFFNPTSTAGCIGVMALMSFVSLPATTIPVGKPMHELQKFVTYATSTGQVCAEGNAITEIRRISGLTFEQLSKVFAVTRRTLHLWVSGQRMQPAKQEQVQRTLAAVRRIDRGAPDLTLAALLADGAKAFDLLVGGELSRVEDLLGVGRSAKHPAPPRLSTEEMAARKPPSPADLVQATQDGPHPATRDGRRIKSMKATRIPRGK